MRQIFAPVVLGGIPGPWNVIRRDESAGLSVARDKLTWFGAGFGPESPESRPNTTGANVRQFSGLGGTIGAPGGRGFEPLRPPDSTLVTPCLANGLAAVDGGPEAPSQAVATCRSCAQHQTPPAWWRLSRHFDLGNRVA
jgi:hypothetical protein